MKNNKDFVNCVAFVFLYKKQKLKGAQQNGAQPYYASIQGARAKKEGQQKPPTQ